jgi:Ca2+-binding EF-hand superfamily protein
MSTPSLDISNVSIIAFASIGLASILVLVFFFLSKKEAEETQTDAEIKKQAKNLRQKTFRTRMEVMVEMFNTIKKENFGKYKDSNDVGKKEFMTAIKNNRRIAAYLDFKNAEEEFMNIDTDNNGRISFTEFFDFVNKQDTKNRQSSRAKQVFDELDLDSDGSVDRAEFNKALKETTDLKNYIDLLEKENPNSHLEDNPVSVFDKIDTNHDGRISWDEFSSFVKKNKDNAIRNVFKRIDKGGDGTINSGEFLMALKKDKNAQAWLNINAGSGTQSILGKFIVVLSWFYVFP